jgi:hypothetical protein
LGVVDRAGADDYEKPAVLVTALNDFDCLIAALQDGVSRLLRLRNLALEEIWGCKRVVTADAPILRVGSIAD